ncbi:glycoside hydrolase family 43 protein [Penicillium macrosclerotiorum]|uniref:glycoside hydrolase family 43 protein n=1 Tax=Penicillium macrosclerotiorum TaxID=303699 RepID=UPI002547EC78|nr:glycoside hydrolase family 43 protein [Penicillium macrosclerotiorum]KAJ5692280.1 glycoside hydrolase family 43 protein [Penicillium macrosclerotiorum]
MALPRILVLLLSFQILPGVRSITVHNTSYQNPVLPGWHSDPSCTRVDELFFCVTSTFDVFPGLPIYVSKDLLDWKLVSHAWNRESQLPGYSAGTAGQQLGHYAATIRYHDGTFYVICVYLGAPSQTGVLYSSKNPYNDSAWSDPVIFDAGSIDPDLFWDDDGKVYTVMSGITLQEIDIQTGNLSDAVSMWNGTGAVYPEGPHLYKKDGFYYLLIAEGGTELNHSISIARSTKIGGPYISYQNNPILTNRGTNEYFQTVGHGDLFQDANGNWWGVCLATRGGPAWRVYPMGRETVLFPVTWKKDEWPVLETVRGQMTGWPLPSPTRNIPGKGPFNSDPDVYDFEFGTDIPRNLVHFRVPQNGDFSVTPKGLEITPSRSNLTGSSDDPELNGQKGLGFIGRRQTDTFFTFTVDVTFNPTSVGHEAGVTVFLTQMNHIDLGLVLLNSQTSSQGHPSSRLYFRFKTEAQTMDNSPVIPASPPPPKIVPVPHSWIGGKIRFQIKTINETHYEFSAMPSANPNAAIRIGIMSAQFVSGGSGTFVGSLIGMYATCNGIGSGSECPSDTSNVYFDRWRYTGNGQAIF